MPGRASPEAPPSASADNPVPANVTAARGYVTVAARQRHYLEFAIDLALSVRAFNPEPMVLALDDGLRAGASAAQLAVFDQVVALPPGYPGTLVKLAVPHLSPFARTLLLDADCLAIASFAELWRRLDTHGFAVQGRYLAADEDLLHHAQSTAALAREFSVTRYLKSNTGIVYFRKQPGIACADACMRLYRRHRRDPLVYDETLIALTAEAQGISTIPPPLPMPWWPDAVEPHDPAHQLVHVMGPLKPATMAWLMRDVRRRREAASLPPGDSVAYWHWKMTRFGQARRTDAARAAV